MVTSGSSILRIGLISVFVIPLNSCFTASVFTLPQRETEAANERQDYLAAAALPVAVVADVVTAPVQLGAIGAYSVAKAVTRSETETHTDPEGREPSSGEKARR